MSAFTTWIVIVSMSALIVLSVGGFLRDRRLPAFALRLTGLAFACALLHLFFDFPLSAQAKGGSEWEDAFPVIGLYLAMTLGMISQYAYAHFSQSTKKKAFDWGNFVAPIFASPIIFIPIYETLKSAPAAHASAMPLLIAFENGFFFKNFMDQRRNSRGNTTSP